MSLGISYLLRIIIGQFSANRRMDSLLISVSFVGENKTDKIHIFGVIMCDSLFMSYGYSTLI